ncbi:MAG: prolyl oligopeptidase family serine peptidase [Chlamydiota bacterium]
MDSKVDNYHGVEVKDPYRYLEDLDSEETKEWVQAQNLLTFDYLSQIPEREAIRKRLESLWDYERYGLISKKGSRYFFTKNDGLQNQYVLYTFKQLGETPEVLLDPNLLSSDGTTSLNFYSPSEDGKLLAYGISRAGSDWVEIKVLDVQSKKELSDHVKWVKFSGASWLQDGTGFYYTCYDKPAEDRLYEALNYHQKVYFHKMGTSQEEDLLVHERLDHKDWMFQPLVTEDGKYLVISVVQGAASKNAVFYKDLTSKGPLQELFSAFDARYDYIGNEGTLFWFKTDLNASKGRVIAVDLNHREESAWKEVIPESRDTLLDVSLVGDRFVVSYLKDAHSQIRIFNLDGFLEKSVALPSLGTAEGFSGKRQDREAFYTFTSFTDPSTVYRYDFLTGESSVIFQPNFPASLENFEIKQVFYKSPDGTEIPMFIVSRKGLILNGSNPLTLYGYGGFDVSVTPFFSPAVVAWLEMGGVFAVANIRGGGEYGEAWHNAGKLENKQKVFDDFIAAAEWLIAEKITSPAKLSITGGSNGGLLVGACITQRPELFGAAVPSVAVLDMLRYHKFTIGWAWIPEYGSSEDAFQFSYLYKYSPLHNVFSGRKYPPVLILTADHDDRVVPAHSFKFAATLQESQGTFSPLLIRIETSAGHGAGKPTTKLINETADKFAFLVKQLEMQGL